MRFHLPELADLSRRPAPGTAEHLQWLQHADLLAYLLQARAQSEVILFASVRHLFLYSVLVPTRLVRTPDVDDLHGWQCNPFSGWGLCEYRGTRTRVAVTAPLTLCGSSTIEKGEQIVFGRTFAGRMDAPTYIELGQKLTHLLDIHFVAERSAYCRFDECGDIQDVVSIEAGQVDSDNALVVAIRRSDLERYMAFTRSTLVRLIDSVRLPAEQFAGFRGETRGQHVDDVHEIYLRRGLVRKEASYVRPIFNSAPKNMLY